MTDDKTLDLDAIRERLDLWEEGRQFGLEATGKLGAWSTDSADLLEELEAALALDVGPLLREVERLTGERDQLRTEVAAQAYHESHNPCDVCTHMQVEDLVLEVERVTAERDRARDLAAALEAELAGATSLESAYVAALRRGDTSTSAPSSHCGDTLAMSDPGPCACALMPCGADRGATDATSAKHAHIHCCLSSEGACHGLDFEVTHLDNSGCERPHEELRAWLDHERRH